MPPVAVRLMHEDDLERSCVVANCRMNRERELAGGNGYGRELGFGPVDFLLERARVGRTVHWLDLCCGTGRALFQAAQRLRQAGQAEDVTITGVDLVGMFWPGAAPEGLRLVTSSLRAYEPAERLDLITCVHGLHYVGDKLKAVERSLSWLVADGLFAAHLDLANLRREDGKPLARRVARLFREAGLAYNGRKRLLVGRGRREVGFPLGYLGADDGAGPNFTGQAAVHSYYREESG
jgi:SAM-dependent methyltransferase